MTNPCLVLRLREPLPQHCIWSSVLCVLRTVWNPPEPGLPQAAGEVSHHPSGSTGEGNGLGCSSQGTDALAIRSSKMNVVRYVNDTNRLMASR